MAQALFIAGVATMATGQLYQAQQAKREAKAASRWHQYSAIVEQREAKAAKEAAEVEEWQARREGRRLKAKQRAAYGAAGVTIEGSPIEVLSDTAAELEKDYLLIREKGKRAESFYKSRAHLELLKAKTAKQRAKAAWTAGLLGTGGTLATGYGEYKEMYGQELTPGSGTYRFRGRYRSIYD